jgi:hypothetical protein
VGGGCGLGFKGSRFLNTALSEWCSLGSTETWLRVLNVGKQILDVHVKGCDVRQGCARRPTAGIGRKGSVAVLRDYADVMLDWL